MAWRIDPRNTFAPEPSEQQGAASKPEDTLTAVPAEAAANAALPGGWRLGLVVTASALCGGIAVVLWNRRLLTRMREAGLVARADEQGRNWEDDQ